MMRGFSRLACPAGVRRRCRSIWVTRGRRPTCRRCRGPHGGAAGMACPKAAPSCVRAKGDLVDAGGVGKPGHCGRRYEARHACARTERTRSHCVARSAAGTPLVVAVGDAAGALLVPEAGGGRGLFGAGLQPQAHDAAGRVVKARARRSTTSCCARCRAGPASSCGPAASCCRLTRSGRVGGRPPAFDRDLCKTRNVVERCFNRLRQFRAVATRFDKLAVRYRAGLHLAALILWLREPVSA